MTRLIVLGLLLVILRLALKNFSGQLKAALSGGTPARPHPPAPRQVSETLVPCARCGTYVASSRALKGTGEAEVFCSEECRKRGAA
ncbi:MAG TPA: hypothetical protein VGG03_07505 [Thermoanaerobaculia bacterium]|jgi:hypothetical protein